MARKRVKHDPDVKRTIEALKRAHLTAEAAWDAATAANRAAGVPTLAGSATAQAAWKAAMVLRSDLTAARKCATLADLIMCDRPAVRAAAVAALDPTPPAQKRKR